MVGRGCGVGVASLERADIISCSQCPENKNASAWQLAVSVEEETFPVEVEEGEEGFVLSIAGNRVDVSSDWYLGQPMMEASISGNDVTIHVSCTGGGERSFLHVCTWRKDLSPPPYPDIHRLWGSLYLLEESFSVLAPLACCHVHCLNEKASVSLCQFFPK